MKFAGESKKKRGKGKKDETSKNTPLSQRALICHWGAAPRVEKKKELHFAMGLGKGKEKEINKRFGQEDENRNALSRRETSSNNEGKKTAYKGRVAEKK